MATQARHERGQNYKAQRKGKGQHEKGKDSKKGGKDSQ